MISADSLFELFPQLAVLRGKMPNDVIEMISAGSAFELFPQLATLRGKMPDEMVEREVLSKAERFAKVSTVARERIPTVRLGDIFPAEVESGRIVLERFLGRWGNIAVEEACKLALICSWRKPRAIFEFGTYNGMTTLQFVLNSPEGCVVHTLDIAPESAKAEASEIGGIDGYLVRKAGAFQVHVGEYFLQHPLAHRIHQLFGNSLKFDFAPFANAVDLVFVDGGHTYECAKSDTDNALRMLSRGGVILWHNYMDIICPEVTECLLEYVDRGLDIFHLSGTRLAVYYQRQ